MNLKYQVFVSSTFEDLRDEREQVVRAVLEMGHIPVGMEMFSAADEEQWKLISRQIELSDYYVVILAHRYGSTDHGISFTEKEYDFAVRSGVPVLGFVLDDGASWPTDQVDVNPALRGALTKFKEKIKKRYVSFWSNSQDLYGAVPIALMKQMTTNPRTGWIRASDVAGPETTAELARLSRENAELRGQLSVYVSTQVEKAQSAREKTINILKRNQVNMVFWYRDGKAWDDPKEVSLYDIFRLLAPDLLVEKSTVEASHYLARMIKPGNALLRTEFPIPRNLFQGVLADLATLDLVEPSKRKHLAKDTHEYWSLTDIGREVLQDIRRSRLEAGVGEAEEESKKAPAGPGDDTIPAA